MSVHHICFTVGRGTWAVRKSPPIFHDELHGSHRWPHRTRPSRQERQEHNLSVGSSTTSCMDRSNGRIPTELAPIGKNGKNTGAGYWIPSNDLDRPDLWRNDGKKLLLLRPCPTTHSVCISRALPRAWAFSFITVYLKLPKILPGRMTH